MTLNLLQLRLIIKEEQTHFCLSQFTFILICMRNILIGYSDENHS